MNLVAYEITKHRREPLFCQEQFSDQYADRLKCSEYQTAVEYADEALVAANEIGLSNDIAARALRAAASIYTGIVHHYFEEEPHLRNQTPVTDVDRVLTAIALMLHRPDYSLEIIEGTPSARYSAIGILVRGMAGMQRAGDLRNTKLFEQAVRDLEYAMFLFRDSPATLAWYVTGIAAYIEVSKQIGDGTDVSVYVTAGEMAIEKLPTSGEFVHGDHARWLFFRAIGKDEQASAAVRRLGPVPSMFCLFTAADHIRRADVAEAAREFERCIRKERMESPWVRISFAFLALELPDGEKRFEESTKDLLKEPPGIAWRCALSAMCLAKTRGEIRELAKSGGAEFLTGNDEWGVWIGYACHRLLAGVESEADVLEEAQGRQFALCNAHFTIAVLRLADGKREEALEHFTLCKETAIVGSPDCELARAFHERMLANPDWMPLSTRKRASVGASREK